MQLQIIVDTREKQPWTFSQSESVGSVVSHKLDTGDYSLVGLEDKLCIERKQSVSELASNITQPRFRNVLQRMSAFPYKFLLLEFDYGQIDKYPMGSNIPKSLMDKVHISGAFIMKFLSEVQIKYGVHVVPCSNSQYAEHVAINIMKRVYEIYGER